MADQPVDARREALLQALAHGGAQFILIGGAALQSHGQAYVTQDVDITPARSPENLARLAAILNTLDCRLVVDAADASQDVPLPAGYFTAENLGRQESWNLATQLGKLDIAFAPSGFPSGYEQLRRHAEAVRVAQTSLTVAVAALDDIEHSKRVAARPKDRRYLRSVGRLQPPQPPNATAR